MKNFTEKDVLLMAKKKDGGVWQEMRLPLIQQDAYYKLRWDSKEYILACPAKCPQRFVIEAAMIVINKPGTFSELCNDYIDTDLTCLGDYDVYRELVG